VAVADSWMFCPSLIFVGMVRVSIVGGRLLMVRLTVVRLEICPSLPNPR
jgi:hypothetical protein